jgi:hypothetical protein
MRGCLRGGTARPRAAPLRTAVESGDVEMDMKVQAASAMYKVDRAALPISTPSRWDRARFATP